MSATRTFIVYFEPGPGWVIGLDLFGQELDEHEAYLRTLAEAGEVLLAGPLTDGTAAVTVLRVPDEATARARVAADPAVRDGLFEARVVEWSPIVTAG